MDEDNPDRGGTVCSEGCNLPAVRYNNGKMISVTAISFFRQQNYKEIISYPQVFIPGRKRWK